MVEGVRFSMKTTSCSFAACATNGSEETRQRPRGEDCSNQLETTEVVVPWVTGRRQALVFSVAVEMANSMSTPLSTLHHASRAALLRRAEGVVSSWEQQGVLLTFDHPYRE